MGDAAAAGGAGKRGGAGWLTLRDPGGRGSMARGGGPEPGTRAWPGRAGRGRGARCPGVSGLCSPDGPETGRRCRPAPEPAPEAETRAGRGRRRGEGAERNGEGLGRKEERRGVHVQTLDPGKPLTCRGTAGPGDGSLSTGFLPWRTFLGPVSPLILCTTQFLQLRHLFFFPSLPP